MNHFNIFPCVSDHLRAMYNFSKLQRGEALGEVEISSIPKILISPREAAEATDAEGQTVLMRKARHKQVAAMPFTESRHEL